MSNVDCPSCGASYPAEEVQHLDGFVCGRCGSSVEPLCVVEPMDAPPEVESIDALPVIEPIGALPVVAPIDAGESDSPPSADRPAPRVRRAARTASPAERKRGLPPAVWVGGGVALVGAVAVAAALSSGKSAATATAAAKTAEAAMSDPTTDVAAWKALPATEREKLASRFVDAADVADAAAVKRAADFLAARGESAATTALAGRVVARHADDAWANAALGRADVAAEVDACLAQCEQADEDSDAGYAELKAGRAKHVGASWWADADAAKSVRDRIAQVRKAEERLRTPYGQGVAKWIRRQGKIDVMKEFPSLSGSAGPYVIFVSLDPRTDEDRKKGIPLQKEVTLADVPAERRERGAKILSRNLKLYADFYDGWMQEMGPRFGFTRYGPENADFATLMKVNVFANPKDFFDYNQRVGAGVGAFTRAYYWGMEPRFITTFDGGADEDADYTDQVQCHEGVHQLVHFYTWDLTRKEQGREIDWLECGWRPLWSGEGFAEFFSSHKVVDGKYVWMQPLDERMRQIWVFEEMVKEKGWRPWRLSEFFSMSGGGEMNRLAASRGKTEKDEWIAEGVMGNLFYGKAWSFVYFLWYAEENGKPKYRDRYVDYLKAEFHVPFVLDPAGGKKRPSPAWSGTFGRIMGLSTGAQWDAIESEWNAYTAKLVAANRKPAWDAERAKMRKNFGFDKASETK